LFSEAGADDVEVFGRAGGGLDDGGVHVGYAAHGQEDLFPAEGLGRAQDGAEVVRVLDVVDEQAAGIGVVRLVQAQVGIERAFQHRALVFEGAGAVAQFLLVGPDQLDPGLLDQLRQLGQARMFVLGLIEEGAADLASAGADGFEDGVDAKEEVDRGMVGRNMHDGSVMPPNRPPRKSNPAAGAAQRRCFGVTPRPGGSIWGRRHCHSDCPPWRHEDGKLIPYPENQADKIKGVVWFFDFFSAPRRLRARKTETNRHQI
jgi:hypothetical protein